MNVTPIDWMILAGLFAGSLTLARYLNTYCRTVDDFLVSGRKVRMWLGMGSGIAGEIGLVSIAAMCEQGYLHGFGFVLIGLLNMAIMVPLFGVMGFGIERFRATRAVSVPQYIEMRYSRRLRILTGIFNSLAGVFQMCIFPIVGAMFVRVLIRAPEHVTLLGIRLQTASLIMAVLLSCNIIFTNLGGFVTLVVTNFFHMIVTVGVLYAVLFLLVSRAGLQTLWTNLESTRGLSAFYPFASGQQGSYGLAWFTWLTMMSILLQFSYGPYLQKYAAMDRPKTVSRSYLLGSLFGNGRTFVIMGIGVCALAALGSTQPPGSAVAEVQWNTVAAPLYLSTVVPPILMGILLSGLLFADISTTDQYLLSWSTSIVNDCILPFRKESVAADRHIRLVRRTIMALCALFFLFGLVYTPTIPLWEYMWLCANVIGGTGIAVLFGMYWRGATTAGAYASVFTCLLLPVADLVARRVFVVLRPDGTFPWKPETTGLYSYLLGMLMLVLVSLLSGQKSKYWDLGQVVRELNSGDEPGSGQRPATVSEAG